MWDKALAVDVTSEASPPSHFDMKGRRYLLHNIFLALLLHAYTYARVNAARGGGDGGLTAALQEPVHAAMLNDCDWEEKIEHLETLLE